MPRSSIAFTLLLATVLALGACGGHATDSPKSDEPTVGGLGGSCEVVSTTPVAWTQETALGTPEAVFSAVPGTCQAPFAWDGGGVSGPFTVQPASGQSTVTATVEIDPSSARWVTSESAPTASGGTTSPCPDVLELDATVTLELVGSTIVRRRPVTIGVSDGQRTPKLQFSLAEADFGDWVSIVIASDASTVGMSVEMAPIGAGCAGNVTLSSQTSNGASGTGFALRSFAAWSATGCGPSQTAVDLGQPFRGVDPAAAVKSAFDGAKWAGAWEGGTATVLTTEVSVPAGKVCADAMGSGTVVTIPVDVVASTADQVVSSLSGPGTVRATVTDTAVSQLDLWSSNDLVCGSETATLPYRSADCGTVQKVTAQLGLNQYSASPQMDGGRLELYVYLRASTASPGAADRVDRLELSR